MKIVRRIKNFTDFKKGQNFQDHFWPEKAKKRIKYYNSKSRKKTDNKVELDFSKSENSIINHPHKKFSIHLPKSSVVFLAHLIKDDIKANFRPKVSIKTK